MICIRKVCGNFQGLVIVSITCCFLVNCLIFWVASIMSAKVPIYNPEKHDVLKFYDKTLLPKEKYYIDSVASLQSRMLKEFEYKEKLALMSADEIAESSEAYMRNITLQWAHRTLLPQSKTLFHEKCLDYLDTSYDVTVSIVIVSHNEMPVLLLRLLTTIMHRTLPKYLDEIILIDDASTTNITEEVLAYSREQRIPLRFLHNNIRLGVANSRLRGIAESRGNVVVILDSHMEVSDLWLEPLLHTLFLYPKSVAVPLLDMIKESQYGVYGERKVKPFLVKPRHGHGVITMHPLPDDSNRAPWEPFQSPALLGGALAAFKTTLQEFYPAGVFGSSWGVENTRLSFRMWMCAEGIWVVPCSQVLHPNGEDTNLSRYFPPGRESLYDKLVNEISAELINFMFTDLEKEKVISKVTNNDEHQKMIWDLADEIRASFDPDVQGCRQYDHYRNEVLGPSYLSWEEDQFDHVGRVKSKSNPRFCMEFSTDKTISVYECRHAQPVLLDRQVIGFTKNHHIRNPMDEYLCADSSDYRNGTLVKLWSCNNLSPVSGSPSDSQYFVFENQQIIQPPSDRCMELVTGEGNKSQILLRKCDLSSENQRWEINTSPWFL